MNHETSGPSRQKTGTSALPEQKSKTKYVRNSRTISGRLHDELVMMDIEQGKYFSLNPVATRIWDLLEEQMTMEEICIDLQEEYDIDKETCKNDVQSYLSEMVKLRLITAIEIQ